MLMRNPDRDEAEVDEAKALSAQAAEEAAKVEEQLSQLEETVRDLLAGIPNLLDDNVPDGEDDSDNEQVEKWGDVDALPAKLCWPTDGSFEPKWHDDVATALNGWQAENAIAISGSRFVALSGNVARLERAICSFFLDMHVHDHRYTEVLVPYVV